MRTGFGSLAAAFFNALSACLAVLAETLRPLAIHASVSVEGRYPRSVMRQPQNVDEDPPDDVRQDLMAVFAVG